MSNDFPSINNILKPTSASTTPINDATDLVKGNEDIESTEVKFTEKMKEIEIKEKEHIIKQQAEEQGLPYIDLSGFPVSAEALRALPEKLAREKKAVCFFYNTDQLRVGAIEKNSEVEELLYQLGERFHAEVALYLISEHSFERVLKLYGNLPIINSNTKFF
jgi:type IV pilus assembly protein PilB